MSAEGRSTGLSWIRRGLAGSVLLVGLISVPLGWFRSCEQKAFPNEYVVKVCKSSTITDASVIFIILLFLFLMAPDLAQAGWSRFALKRRVREQSGRDDRDVRDRLLDIWPDGATESAPSPATGVASLSRSQVKRVQKAIGEKAVELVSVQESEGGSVASHEESHTEPRVHDAATAEAREQLSQFIQTEPSAATDEERQLRIDLLSIWEKLDSVLELTPYRPPDRLGSLLALTSEGSSARFVTTYWEELEVVRLARNAVVHDKPLRRDVLEGVVQAGRDLLRVLGRTAYLNIETGVAQRSDGGTSSA